MKDDSLYPMDTWDTSFGALTFPIYQTSSFELPRGEKYRYSRENNPTVEALAEKVAALEGMERGNCFSSGMAAITTTLLTTLKPGREIVIQRDLFARTFRFVNDFLRQWGITVKIAPPGTDGILGSVKSGSVVFLETITNPLLRVSNLKVISERCHEVGATLIVDSTFATPYNIKCGESGADVAIHSASKFIGGHNDLIAGVLSGSDKLVGEIDLTRRNLGGSLDPHTAFLVMRGIKTLGLRMMRINESAMKIAEFLSEDLGLDVIYPGLETHPDHDVAKGCLRGYGGVVVVNTHLGTDDTLGLISRMRIVKAANTLGGLTTTVTHPYTMSHRGLSVEEKEKAGIGEGMIRISVGIEDPDDLMDDLGVLGNKV